jgi:polysaccharide biosynthesis transport protein
VSNAVLVARTHVNSLEDSLAKISRVSATENQTRVKLIELQSTAASSRSLYETFLSKFKETQGQSAVETPDARVISRAQLPKNASAPNKTQDMELAIAGGLFLGFLLAMLEEKLDAGFRTGIQVERLLELPVLATLPEVRKLNDKETSVADRVIVKPLSAYAEGVRGLQMGLVLSNVDRNPKVVIVSSSVPDEGKTTVAISLARIAALSGKKVVLMDCDLRRPGVARMMGQKGLKCGLVHLLAGKAKLEDCLVKDPLSNVMIMPAVGRTASPPDILGSAAMAHFMKHLRDHYDLIVIDSAPLLAVNDTKILTGIADTLLFVVRWEKTPREAAIGALRGLATSGAPVAGVVLARADSTRHHYYSYGHGSYQSYRKYYAE